MLSHTYDREKRM